MNFLMASPLCALWTFLPPSLPTLPLVFVHASWNSRILECSDKMGVIGKNIEAFEFVCDV